MAEVLGITMVSATVNGISMNGVASNLVFPSSSQCFFSFPQISPPSSPSSCSSFWSFKKVNHVLRASSSEGLPSEIVEDSKFVPLDSEDLGYGPTALLLLGFKVEEAEKMQQLLKDLDGEFMQIIYCTEDMLTRSLWEAVNSGQQDLGNLKIAESVPRVCFLSGLSGEEMMMFIDAIEETDIEPAVFAAHVANSSNKPLLELVEEIMGDHEMLSTNKTDSE